MCGRVICVVYVRSVLWVYQVCVLCVRHVLCFVSLNIEKAIECGVYYCPL